MNRTQRRRLKKHGEKSGQAGQTVDIQAALQQAVAHHRAGRLQQASHIYQQILQATPGNPEALHLLGVVAHQLGRHETAAGLISHAIEVDPTQSSFYSHLGNALKAQDKLDEAIANYNHALELDSNHTDALNNLGIIFKDQGRLDEAIAHYRRALEINPECANTHNNLGNALAAQDRPEEAIASYNRALEVNPDHVAAYNNRGRARESRGRLEKAIADYNRAVEIDPDYANAYYNQGHALLRQGKCKEAIAGYRRGLKIAPGNADAHNNLGVALERQGKLDEAINCYRWALQTDPHHAEAYRHLALTRRHTGYDDDMRAMEDLLQRPDATEEQQMHLNFGLGKAYEDLHEYEKAFGFFSAANKIMRDTFTYRISDTENHFKNLKNIFDGQLLDQYSGLGCRDRTPIFIVGMPRSGTTLVEQILAGHYLVHGAGKLLTLEQVLLQCGPEKTGRRFPDYVRKLDRGGFTQLGDEYIKRVREHSDYAQHITDKMPHNFFFLGMINLILPEAKIIHCRRDPIDTGLACFKNYFTDLHKYAYDLAELGRYYTLYQDLMSHWHSVLPGCILDVQYEDLVTDQEIQIRRLLDYCGLPWDDACLSPHKMGRSVSTASTARVRQPIDSRSVHLWKRYEKQLAPLIDALAEEKSITARCNS